MAHGFRLFLALALSVPIGAAGIRVDQKPEPKANLVVNGDFEQGKHAPDGWERPDGARVRWEKGVGGGGTRGICIEMDEEVAFGYGQGYFSRPIPVRTDTEYKLSVDVKSDAPNAIVFVKGYAKVRGKYREVYSHHKEAHFDRYLGKHIATGEFVTQGFSFHPRHHTYRVEHVKIWLYGYLRPGKLYFDNVRIETAGKAKAESKPEPPTKKRPRPRPPDPDGESSPPIYLDPIDVSR